MIQFKRKISSVLIGISFVSTMASAQIPVTDYALNTTQQMSLQDSLINTAKSVARTLKQIEEYRTQLQQYQTQLQNMVSIPANLLNDVNMMYQEYLSKTVYLKSQLESLGGLDRAIELFKTSYQNNPCFQLNSLKGCTPQKRAEMIEDEYLLTQLTNAANKDVIKHTEMEEKSIIKDSQTVNRMNDNVMKISGNKDGLQSLGQMLGELNKQFISLRSAAAKNDKAVAMERMKAEDKEAKGKAYFESMVKTGDKPLDLKEMERAWERDSKNWW